MKKLILLAAILATAFTGTLRAEDAKPPADHAERPKRAPLTAEQKELMKEIKAKYDTNKDGKLDKTERAAISKEDHARMDKAGLGRQKGGPKGDHKGPKGDKPTP